MAVINGTNGNDSLTSNAGNDDLYGGNGNDSLYGGSGQYDLYGGNGNDQLRIIGGSDLSDIYGGAGNDTLEGRKGAYGQFHFLAGDGDDTIIMDVTNQSTWGWQGHHVYGGDGADRLEFKNVGPATGNILGRIDDFDAARDSIWINNTEIDLNSTASLTAANARIVEYLGQQWLVIDKAGGYHAFFALEGARELTRVVGGEESHFLTKDVFDAFVANLASLPSVAFINQVNFVDYTLYEGVQVNVTRFTGSANVQNGTAGDDYFYVAHSPSDDVPGANDNTISALAGNDVINSSHGYDTVYGGAGNDSMAGGMDLDLLYGDLGNDRMYGGSENDTLYGGNGTDWVSGCSGNDKLNGEAGSDTIFGGSDNDTLWGNADNDSMIGGADNDWLVGGAGLDTLKGNEGNDQFFFYTTPDAGDTISDFGATAGNDDRFSIDASGFGGGLTQGWLAASKFILRTNSNEAGDADDRFIYNTANNTLWFDSDGTGAAGPVRIATLQTNAADLTASDFWLF